MLDDWETIVFKRASGQLWLTGKLKELENRLQWRRGDGTPKERRFVRVAGVAPDITTEPFTHSLDNLKRAVLERVFRVKGGDGFIEPPRPAHGHFRRSLTRVATLLDRVITTTAPVSHMNFVNEYKGRKRSRYLNALEHIRNSRCDLENEARLSVFVKFEKTDRTSKLDPVPRVISPRDPRFNIRIGRYLKPLEKLLFQHLAHLFGHPTVMKGYNAYEIARLMHEKWNMFSNPVAIGLDASRFDQHVSLEALRWEHEVYLKYFEGKHKTRLRKLLKLQEVNHCYGTCPDGELRYTIIGTRMSGDMNTSMGNCLLMCSMIKAFADAHRIKCQLANNGDDCVMFMEKEDYERIKDDVYPWFLKLGFNMVVEPPSYSMEEIEFCQTRPVFDGERWLMCRNPITGIVKDSVLLKPWGGEKFFRGWLDAVGTGGLAISGALPIFQEFYQLYVRSGRHRPVSEDLLPWNVIQLGKGMDRKYGIITPAARASFYWAFGITPDEQICLEGHYASMSIGTDLGQYRCRAWF